MIPLARASGKQTAAPPGAEDLPDSTQCAARLNAALGDLSNQVHTRVD